MFSRKVLESVYKAQLQRRGKFPLAVLPIIAIGGAAAAADNKLTPQQEKVLHQGSAPDKAPYMANAKGEYENHPPRVGREPTEREKAEGRTDRFHVTPTITGTSATTSYNQTSPTYPGSSNSTSTTKVNLNPTLTGTTSSTGSMSSTSMNKNDTGFQRYFDKDFWSRPLDESSAILGTYVRQASLDLQKSPLRAEHQFSTVLAGEDLEDRGPDDSLLKRVTHKVGEYLPHSTTHDTRKDYSYSQRDDRGLSTTDMKDKAYEMKDKGVQKMEDMKDKAYDMKDKGAEKMGEMKDKAYDMKDKAADTAYNLKEKTKEVATDAKDKMSDKLPTTQEMKDKLVDTKDKAADIGSSIKNKVSEYIPTSLSSITDTVKSVVVGSDNNESKVPGDSERFKTRLGEEAANLLQSHAPINAFKTHTATVRVFADEPKRQLLTQKYTAHINEDVMQTLIMDSDRADAKLIGIEYCISDKVYKQLPEEEKKFWYSHAFETKSGLEVAPRLPNTVETKLMSDLAPTYGKAISLWQVDKDLLPVGFPKLLAPPANEQMINSSVWEKREKMFGPVSKDRQLRVPSHISVPNPEESWEKKGAIFTPEYKKL